MANDAEKQRENALEGAAKESKSEFAPEPHQYKGPGRLGNPLMELKDDPRANPKFVKAMAALGADRFSGAEPVTAFGKSPTMEQLAEWAAGTEAGIMAMYSGAIPLEVPRDDVGDKVIRIDKTTKGGDGQEMKLHIYRPADQGDKTLSLVVYIHGGGMCMLPTLNPVHERWCKEVASNGVVVLMPDFRNTYTKTGINHFPKGLNDCAEAVKWAKANKDELKVRNIIVQGESGGGNLSLATALKANREGWIDHIDGVFASVPYISNLWGSSEARLLEELPSVIENHGYFLNRYVNTFLGHFYTPDDKDAANPLAWPYHATLQDMKGLPPHVVVVDELDLLRDEGISYHRRLVKAGVESRGGLNLGVTHGSALIFANTMPELHKGLARDVASFAKAL